MTLHQGSTGSRGHYVAFTKRDGVWYKFDDEVFREVSEDEALDQEVYLLFYQRIN
jgi:ubiquitin C-terminal hydrolase